MTNLNSISSELLMDDDYFLGILTESAVTPKKLKNESALYEAVRDKDIVSALKLIEGGAKEDHNPKHPNPLRLAIEMDNMPLVKLLTESGFSYDHKAHGTRLNDAIRSGSIEMVQYFLDHGDDIRQKHPISPFISATKIKGPESRMMKMADYLLSNGAEVNNSIIKEDGVSNLSEAIRKGCSSLYKFLINHGADINRLSGGEYPLEGAYTAGDFQLCERILELGADINLYNPTTNIPLMIAAAENNETNYIHLFLKYGADINIIDDEMTPLSSAIINGNIALAKLLIELGADVNARAENCDGPIHAACTRSLDITKFLIRHGAGVNVLGNFSTPLIRAIEEGKLNVVKELVKSGADLEGRSRNLIKFAITPLQMAAKKGEAEIVELLLKSGANIHAIDDGGETALDYTNGIPLLVNVRAVLQDHILKITAESIKNDVSIPIQTTNKNRMRL